MKKLLILFVFTLLALQFRAVNIAKAEDLLYPFDSITIVEAFRFDVEITVLPSSTSLLYNQVELGDVLTVYVGALEFVKDGVPSSGSGNVLIITNEADVDLLQFLVNNYTFYPSVSVQWGFASHILIDPAVGVFKDMDILQSGSQEMTVYHDLTLDTWKLFDNTGLEMPFMVGTYAEEPSLNIVISAYGGV